LCGVERVDRLARRHARRLVSELGGNAARVYGFDVGKLEPVARRVGPKLSELDPRA